MFKQISVGQEAYNVIRDTALWISMVPPNVYHNTIDLVADDLVDMFHQKVKHDLSEVCGIVWEDNKVVVYYGDDDDQVELIA